MSHKGAHEIAFRTDIAPCKSGAQLRAYMQDVSGKIRETLYDDGWTKGTDKDSIATAKLSSPICCATKEPKMFRVYYLSVDNILKEVACDDGNKWYEGSMGKSKITVAPYSKLAACYLEGQDMMLRAYCQMPDNSIQEFGYDNDKAGWKKMQSLGTAMPGTEICCTSFKMSDMSIRVYFQDMNDGIIENATITTGADKVGIRLFYATSNRLLEMTFDGKRWNDGNFHVNCIPGTEMSCLSWGGGNNINMRVYFQKGEQITGISEWVWNKGTWNPERLALPPA
ncbi:hypothetical protein N7474_003188 [Penicillium riverlandense]|uniref:uncharacterized protein n=1 Tax=Penicillium riverlandense TaxID=1903569 RepID=UPI002546A497|nr:uncharacterized protein N7474_003188 [Penicillium riverlandense]KAJ5826050.1 hypothetical protein N7474_003188 [Penicillium riverlandense]